MPLLSRWSPFSSPFASILDEMARWRQTMDPSWGMWPATEAPMLAASYPALNVWQDDAFVYAEAELPGIDLTNLEIFVTGEDLLTIKGNRPQSPMKHCAWHRQERGFGPFTRVQELPFPVQSAKVEARLEHGILTIKMPKTEAAKPRLIPIRAG